MEAIFQKNGMLERLKVFKPSDFTIIASIKKNGWANKEINVMNRHEMWPNTGLLGWQAHDVCFLYTVEGLRGCIKIDWPSLWK